jgi:peptidoglycan hydrolase FlgJ
MELLTRAQWAQKYYPLALEVTKNTGVYPGTLLVQAILESSRLVNGVSVPGASKLSREAKNYFGIKAGKNYKGAKYLIKTREVIKGKEIYINDYFRKYNSIKKSFQDYVNFLQTNTRYKKALEAPGAKKQLELIAAAGYATDPNYANIATSILNKFGSFAEAGAVAVKNNPGKVVLFASIGLYLLLSNTKK